ncbi:MAG: hypothetical protein IH957_09555 [Chloroflexi bacterium]|nr:hypothetical protein [Chloroflexota bacterium]
MSIRSIAALLFTLATFVAFGGVASAEETDLIHISSDVTYDLRGEDNPVSVSWQITIDNNDPSTGSQSNGGSIAFYDSVSIPFLRGAESVQALDANGETLSVAIDQSSDASIVTGTIEFAERLFFEETYNIALTYELREGLREQSLLVTPSYLFVPIVASGDEATVTIIPPQDGEWETIVTPEDCEADGLTFTCSGSESAYLVATAESSRPNALSSFPLEVELQDRTLSITVSYFEGDEPFADHLRELIPAALPIIEDRSGFAYARATDVAVAQGGRQSVLGYEGVTSCQDSGCEIVVSPIADDITIIHELAHLWSDIYAERWLSEGFAQLVAEETAAALPPDLVQGEPPIRRSAGVELQLDQWGEVSSVIGADAGELAIENAGYDLSLRFLETLRFEVGSSALRDVNAAIAASGEAADSQRYIDLVEEISGRNVDQFFATWVFPKTYDSVLESRRIARDRLTDLETRALVEDLPEGATAEIRDHVTAWRFDSAVKALDDIDANIARYNSLSDQLIDAASRASSLGLSFPGSVADSLDLWQFDDAQLLMAGAQDAMDSYRTARETVFSNRDIWERFGLLGSDPRGQLDDAASSFAAAQFQTSIGHSEAAVATIEDASAVAVRRVLIVTGIFAVAAIIILAAVWASIARDNELADR